MERKKVIGMMMAALLLGVCSCGAAEGNVAMVSGGETAGNQETVEASEIEVSETESSATEASGESETESPATEASEVSGTDNTYAEETEEEEIIRYAGAPQLARKAVVDLDGDGKEETVELNLEEQALVIDGVNYPLEILGDEFVYNKEEFAVVDIDVFDSTKEIVIQYASMGAFPAARIYRYQNQSLETICGFLADLEWGQLLFDGCNHIYDRACRNDLIQTDYIFMEYTLENGKLEEVWPEEVSYENADARKYTLLERLPVYKEKDHSLEPYYIEPQEVTFRKTDGRNWIKVQGADGASGWMYVEQYGHIVDLNKESSEVFDGLIFVD
ncbi:MAG: SH3 domain-containing protein [Roseburia sp.]